MERQKWVSHKFNLGLDPGWAQNVITRLNDLVIRLDHHCKSLSYDQLSFKPSGAWSIKEHIGHLIDLEELHELRLKEFAKFQPELSAADMSNRKTVAANHNDRSLDGLLNDLQTARIQLLSAYLKLAEECLQHEAIHPRLKVPMRPVDLLFFVAEHDDHHLTTILDIKNGF
ncbi:MAG: DinB family protein [Bacteroidia bacterium]|nr:DinB family protein [Bacteroidia bacterium]NNM22615.1 DinB family protein [Flavobacteriaceae bacterium]